MDFKDSVKQIADRYTALKDNLLTEEATKNALIMPFISALGYDVFNPLEVVPEMSCDIGTKKGEKIDYAIMREGKPIMLIECKHWAQDLNLHDNQLLRYFNVSDAKFGVLTNGVIYRFYTDLLEANKMDTKPFLEVNITDLKETQIEELKKFHRSRFDIDNILNSASELKYMGEMKAVFDRELNNPSPDFVKFFVKQVYDGICTAKVVEQFTDLLKRTATNYINDKLSERLKIAIKETDAVPAASAEPEQVAEAPSADDKIVTTEEEMEGFYIVKAICREVMPAERITYRDAQSYFAIFADDNNRRPICRLYLNSPTNKRIATFDEAKKEQIVKIGSVDDIYQFAELLRETAKRYL